MSNADAKGRDFDERLTVKQVAKLYHVCRKTIYRLIDKYDIPVEQIGTKFLIRASHLPLFLTKKW
jgi:excisionase family DNA binding protein